MGSHMSHLDVPEERYSTTTYSKVDKLSLTLPRRARKKSTTCQRTISSGAEFRSTPNMYVDDRQQKHPEQGRRLSRRNNFGSIPNKLEGSQDNIDNHKVTKWVEEESNDTQKNRNCLILKDVNPKDWRKVIKTLPSVKHLSLSTIWFTSFDKSPKNNESLAIAETLNVGNKLSNLRSLSLQEISRPLNFDNLFTFRNHMNNLAELELSNLKIIFTDVDSLAGFSLNLNAHAQSTNVFKLFIRSCEFEITETDLDASCLMLMSLTSRNRMNDITELVSKLKSPDFGAQGNFLNQLRMDYKAGSLSSLLVDHQSFANSRQDVIYLFTNWNLRSLPRKANFENWKIECPTAGQSECSSLLTLLSVVAYQNAHLESEDFHEDKTKIDFGSAVYFPENFSFLQKIIENDFPGKRFHINALTSGIHFQEGSNIENHVELSVNHIEKLQSMGIFFHVAKLNLKVDRSGWAFTKIRLTRDPIAVRFSNGVEISWPRNSTKQSRIVSIEVHKIPDNFVEKVCEARNVSLVKVSPVVHIDQKYDLPFEEVVSVEMPYYVTDSNRRPSDWDIAAINRVFTKHGKDLFWRKVPKSSVNFNSHKFIYKSKRFSPVASISSTSETSLKPDDVISPYLESCVYVTACSSDAFAMNFDCKKFSEEEAREFRVSQLSKIRKVGEMNKDDRIYGAIGGNLKIDERYGYDLEEDKRLIFHYPDPEHMSNPQEYRMLQIEPNLDPEGTVTYYLSSKSQESEMKLFHVRIKLTTLATSTRQSSSLEQTLDLDTVKEILDVCGVLWPDLLRKLNVKSSAIVELEDHNLGDVLLETKRRLNLYQRKHLLVALFSSGGKPVTDIDSILEKLDANLGDQEDEINWKLVLQWLETAPRHVRNIKNLISCLQSSGLTWLTSSVECITPGARHKAANEMIRKFDTHRDKTEFIEEISTFLIKQDDPSCKNTAFDLLLNAHRNK